MIRNTVILLAVALAGVTIIATWAAIETVTPVVYDEQTNPNFTNEELQEIASDDYVETPEEIIERYRLYQSEGEDTPSILDYWERARIQQILPP